MASSRTRLWLLFVWCVGSANCQTQGSRYYNRDYQDHDSYGNTYVYNDRRYGRPNYPGEDDYNRGYGENDGRYHYQVPTGIPQPGVMARWRPDLQGKLRPDSLEQFKRDGYVYVSTSYFNKVQGFKVNLYDNPDPKSGYRPGLTPVERIMGTTTVFLGIPYALPPVKEGRFKPPRRHTGAQLIQAVDFGPACPQPSRYIGATKGILAMDEDCLYLNVYSPHTHSGLAQKYPVMFYIHGGEFMRGASNQFPGHVMAAFYEVVVVTINYRLGALGFLSTGDADSPGNYGILDQAMALQWVYDNIDAFNGDRDKITLFGPDAGAASAGLLMVAPRSRDYVSKVIAQSGSAVADWALIVDRYRAQNTSRVFAQHLGCSFDSSWKLVNCLKQGRSFVEIANAEFQPQVGIFPWGPVLDGNFSVPGDQWYEGWQEKDWHFLWDTPEELIWRGKFNRGLSYMSGVTTQEAAFFIYENETLAPDYTVTRSFVDEKIRELVLRYNYTLNPDGIYQAIKYMYTYWPDPDNNYYVREKYIEMLSDFLYRAPSDKMAKLLVEQNVRIYLYVMNTTIEAFKWPLWRKVPHDTEHYLLAGAPFMDVEFFPARPKLDRNMWTDNDRNMSHFFMKAYSNFAREGNPTHTQILGLHFEMARAGQLHYLNINTTFNSSVLLNYRQTETAFWSTYLPTVIGHLVPTYPPVTEYWWEPKEPLQIAFWSVTSACLLLIVLVVICCILWRNAKRQSDRYYNGDIIVLRDDVGEPGEGIDNHSATVEYRDIPTPSKLSQTKPQNSFDPRRTASTPSLRITGSSASLKDSSNFTTSSPTGGVRKQGTPVPAVRKPKTRVDQAGVPQTEV
ncbi:cholinesterase isoform X1 [Cryptotermes secundus]|nr:cholinesterase isoform X1 [Cryptotermes secundus]